jgi:hypothetical protein
VRRGEQHGDSTMPWLPWQLLNNKKQSLFSGCFICHGLFATLDGWRRFF